METTYYETIVIYFTMLLKSCSTLEKNIKPYNMNTYQCTIIFYIFAVAFFFVIIINTSK